jgi:hypothetical protein
VHRPREEGLLVHGSKNHASSVGWGRVSRQ